VLAPGFDPACWIPPPDRVGGATIERFRALHGIPSHPDLIERAAADPAWYWHAALDFLDLAWIAPPVTTLESNDARTADWFVGGETNAAWLCLERWARTTPDAVALIADGEGRDARQYTFRQLWDAVRGVAGGLHSMGIGADEIVGLCVPLVPEGAIAMLAAAALGAVTVPLYSGYGEAALRDRLHHALPRVVITADRIRRGGRDHELAQLVARAAAGSGVEDLVIVGEAKDSQHSFDELRGHGSPLESCKPVAADHPALILYTSGSTGTPKGTVHTHGGLPYQIAVELAMSADLRRRDRLAWITDFGWIMGAVTIFGPLALGATAVLIDGHPLYPQPDRLWRSQESLELTHLGVSPTLLRAIAAEGESWTRPYELASLRCILTTGEPLDDETWSWAHLNVGRGCRPLVNLTGGTEIGGSILSGCVSERMRSPGFAGPTPGMNPAVLDAEGQRVTDTPGDLVLAGPWPGRTKGLWRDADRYNEEYWSRSPGNWWHGDRAIEHEDGRWELLGRSDDVLNVAGKRLGPHEFEAAAVAVDGVAAACAFAIPDERTGERVVVAVSPARWAEPPALVKAVSEAVERSLGHALRPAAVLIVDELPVTASGKLHRSALRQLVIDPAAQLDPTVANPSSADAIERALAAARASA
jgi:acetyl-CoA synthetase